MDNNLKSNSEFNKNITNCSTNLYKNTYNIDSFAENENNFQNIGIGTQLKQESNFVNEENTKENIFNELIKIKIEENGFKTEQDEHEQKIEKVKLKLSKRKKHLIVDQKNALKKFKNIYKKIKFIKNDNRVQGPPCNCPNECYTLFNEKRQQEIFDEFWRLGSAKEQTDYLLSCIQERRSKKLKNQIILYYLDQIQVCKTAFLNLHGLKRYYLERVCSIFLENIVFVDKNSTPEILEATRYIRDSIEFKCTGRKNISASYKRYSKEVKNCISEHKYRQIFREQLELKNSRMCRICLTIINDNDDHSKLYDLFSVRNNREEEISSSIMKIVPIQFDKTETELPQLICESCLDKLDIALDFRQLCLDSDRVLRNDVKFKKDKIEFYNDTNKDDSCNNDEMDSCNIAVKIETTPTVAPVHEDFDWTLNAEDEDEEGNIITKDELGIDNIKKYKQYEHLKTRNVNKSNAIALGPPCKCPRKCYYLIGKTNIRYIYQKFWNLKTCNLQTSYIHSCLLSKPVAQRTRKNLKNFSSKRGQTIIYRIKKNGEYIRICRQAFLNIHGYKENRMKTILNYLKEKTAQNEPERSHKRKKYTKKTDEIKLLEEELKMSLIQTEDVENVIEEVKATKETELPDDMLPTYKCICGKVFVNVRTYRLHKVKKDHLTEEERLKRARAQRHKPNEKGEWVCIDCNSVFIEEKKYRNHVKVHHTLNHTCEKCGQIFNNRKKLRNHMYKHTGIRHLACNICGRTYYSVDVLGKHKRTHMKEHWNQQLKRLYLCVYCNREFQQSSLLQEHIAFKHTNKEQFVLPHFI